MRVTTLYASSAASSAAYYTKYLTAAPGEVPVVWMGAQADGLGLVGTVDGEQLQALLAGLDPVTGRGLGRALTDRTTSDGRVVKAVAGFDATVSAPKSLSVLWALTGDDRLLAGHDVAVRAVVDSFERWAATTRVRSNGGRLHLDTHSELSGRREGDLRAGEHGEVSPFGLSCGASPRLVVSLTLADHAAVSDDVVMAAVCVGNGCGLGRFLDGA